MENQKKKTPPEFRIGGAGAESNDLVIENLVDEFDMTAADMQDLEQP